MDIPNVSINAVSENAILLEWPEKICPIQHQQIIQCQTEVKKQCNQLIVDTVASYNSLMIYYHFEKIALSALLDIIDRLIAQQKPADVSKSTTTINIPVYYGLDAGWDIAHVANTLALSVDEVIERHSAANYRAYALGFTPGFCYLGELDHSLKMPRRQSPRVKIPKGAVAIAEQQTAVYPNNSPGGWHIIGQTPIAMYSNQGNNFKPLIDVGQQVKFEPISFDTFVEMGGNIEPE